MTNWQRRQRGTSWQCLVFCTADSLSPGWSTTQSSPSSYVGPYFYGLRCRPTWTENQLYKKPKHCRTCSFLHSLQFCLDLRIVNISSHFQGEGIHVIRITTDGKVSEMNIAVSSKTREGMEPLSAECWAHVGRTGVGRSPRIGESFWYQIQYVFQ